LATDEALHVAASKRLRDITLEVNLTFGTSVTAVVGPSGAGKSTLLRMVAGLVHPDAGTITLRGRTLDDAEHGYHLPPAQRDVSMVFQEYALFPHLSVGGNVAYGLEARRIPRAQRRLRVTEMLDRLGIGSLAHERPDRLSGGQRQRVALARALVVGPTALLLDEPLAALDLQTRASVRRELYGFLRDLAIPSLLVTHDYADALVFRERIVVLVAGQVVQDGSHDDLLAHPRSQFVADFTGLNFYEGTLEAPEPDRVARVRLPGGLDLYAAADGLTPGPVSVSLQPWEITLSLAPPEGSARNVLAARVREVLPIGGRVRVALQIGEDIPLVAEITPEALAALHCHEGQLLYASFKATALRVAPR
jgi:molybdate transport system ATP-binding protein